MATGSGCTRATSSRRRDRDRSRSAGRRSAAPSSTNADPGRPVRGAAGPQRVFLQRTKGVGIVQPRAAARPRCHRAALRAAGEPWDLRKAFDYLAYPEMDFKIPIGTVGDNYDRYRVRVAELVESTKIIGQALEALPGGPFIADDRKYVLPAALGALDLDGVADPSLQARHRGLPGRPRRDSTTRSRARAGSSAAFVLADGSSKPARVHFRDPSFVNLQSFKGHGAGLLRRRHDLQPRDARPDPRRGSIDEPGRRRGCLEPEPAGRPRGQRGAHRKQQPGGDPGARRSRLPGRAAGADRAPDEPYPDRKSASIPASGRCRSATAGAPRRGSARPPRGDAGHPPPTSSRSPPSMTSCHHPVGEHRIEVCTNISCLDARLATSCSTPSAPHRGEGHRRHRLRVPGRLRYYGPDGLDRASATSGRCCPVRRRPRSTTAAERRRRAAGEESLEKRPLAGDTQVAGASGGVGDATDGSAI